MDGEPPAAIQRHRLTQQLPFRLLHDAALKRFRVVVGQNLNGLLQDNAAHAAVAVGDGPVYPVLFRAATEGRLDRSAVAYWDAPTPLGGPAIVRGHRLGRPGDRIAFQDGQERSRLVHVLDPAAAYPGGSQGRWWRPTRLRAGPGCYGIQIDGSRFSQVLVVEFG